VPAEAAPRRGREERLAAELAAHNHLVTQLTLLHHQVRSQNAAPRGRTPTNLLADAYYAPVRRAPRPPARPRLRAAGPGSAGARPLFARARGGRGRAGWRALLRGAP